MAFVWDIEKLLAVDYDEFCLIVLNCDLREMKIQFGRLWSRAVCRVCADGAANHVYNIQERNTLTKYVPDIICGDMDSISSEVLTYYKLKGCEIVTNSCQDTTDFTKCVSELLWRHTTNQLRFDKIVTVCSTGGRLDHMMGVIQTLFLFSSDSLPSITVVAPESVTCLLHPGKHRINVGSDMLGTYCGLIPVGHPCNSVTTSGLKWNLDNQGMAFGQLISTSNCVTDDVICVETDQPLLWTMTTEQ
ncbi:thiamin pyrophosphokinase 1-like [Corticium candelabrum]|uniref:thiamin pyrophosphokinase 1-like n=1 Tax=Corticium candelabrum TaxID=121492 RepID=UPI002E26460D|nr:thiamin pyrophosphokinase 1-like [Corticium candelabrum]